MRRLRKNEFLLEKIRLIFCHGFTQLKLYFLIGLPGETMEDIQDLAARAQGICDGILCGRGRERHNAGVEAYGARLEGSG